MLEKAKAKIQDEMKKENNPYVQIIGQFLLTYVEMNPQDAEKILAVDKSIMKSLDEMKKAAEKKKFGNMAILTDAEGFEIICKYFGIKSKPEVSAQTPDPVPPVSEIKTSKSLSTDFDVKLDDFL